MSIQSFLKFPSEPDSGDSEDSRRSSLKQCRILAVTKAKAGKYQDAIAILTHLLQVEPGSSRDYNNRGLMYFKLRQGKKALQDYNQAILLNPTLDNAYNNRGNYYVTVGNLGAALKDYQTALNYNPGNLRALLNQGVTYRELGLYDLALENFDLGLFLGKALRERFYGERGRTYHLRGDWNSAIADYNRALTLLSQRQIPSPYAENLQQWLSQLPQS